jgi:ABC-type molybdate transport system substrate-binding protein
VAGQFVAFLRGPEARGILASFGYLIPAGP